MDPFDAVASWRPVSDRWVRYRPEPLLHERSWGCDVTPEHTEGWRSEGGFDAAGRPIALRHFAPDGQLIDPQIVVDTDGARVVLSLDGESARTVLDAAGRPVRTTYAEGNDERYEYDERGRLVTIHENASVYTGPRFWLTTGGPLTVEYDGDDLARILDAHRTVWEPPARLWAEELREGADAIAAACLEVTRDACHAQRVPPATEVFGLTLTYVDQGSLHFSLSYGLEADRRRWHAAGLEGRELAFALLYLIDDQAGLDWIEEQVVAPELDDRLLRGACMNEPDDPYRAVLGEVAQRLATASFAPMLAKTDDFVAFIAEHDEGLAPKVRSIRAHNPPEQVARWEASWPSGTPRGEDEPS
jgi:YD repeat-containing protein